MKRSEIIRRLETAIGSSLTGDSTAIVRQSDLLNIAFALGVTVEPDEPPLPDRIFLGDPQDRTPRWGREPGDNAPMPGSWAAYPLRSEDDGLHTHHGCLVTNRATAEALITAYNDRIRRWERIPWSKREDTKP